MRSWEWVDICNENNHYIRIKDFSVSSSPFGVGVMGWVANKILETAQSQNSLFPLPPNLHK